MIQDEKRLQQIFYNLIENAVKYAPADSEILLMLKEENHQMKLSVMNDSSLSAKEKERIGERFYRANRDRNRQTGGTGLGLAIVKELVRLLDGQFEIDLNTNAFKVDITMPKEGQTE